jgi:hypothetical protein
MRTLTDLARALDDQIHSISEILNDDLDSLILTIERAYVHCLIEKNLRQRPSVSLDAKHLRGV